MAKEYEGSFGRVSMFRRFEPVLKGLCWLTIAGLFAVIFVMSSSLLRVGGGHDRSFEGSVNHARQVGLALLEFQFEYGSFPTYKTAKRVREMRPDFSFREPSQYSDDYFNQMIAVGLVRNKELLYAKGVASKRPEHPLLPSPIEAGTCGFAYLPSEKGADETHPGRPELAYGIQRQ